MKWLPVFVLLTIFSGPIAYGQMYGGIEENSPNITNQKSATFPMVAYTDDKMYEVDMSWEPHTILTNQKIIFIFQFYDYKTGGLVPMVDYQFVISQNNKELTRISGTTSQAGDYKYFAFEHPGPVTIRLEKIGDTDAFVSFNTTVNQNPNPAGPVTIVQPSPNISNKERYIFPIIEDVIVGALLSLLLWLTKGPILRKLNLIK
ncbi:MAG: hypothetical protein KGI25_03810 [Thaumarchaeota archaeon]|nr:hypothetical protein [Nitrososphaerota archaeon]